MQRSTALLGDIPTVVTGISEGLCTRLVLPLKARAKATAASVRASDNDSRLAHLGIRYEMLVNQADSQSYHASFHRLYGPTVVTLEYQIIDHVFLLAA